MKTLQSASCESSYEQDGRVRCAHRNRSGPAVSAMSRGSFPRGASLNLSRSVVFVFPVSVFPPLLAVDCRHPCSSVLSNSLALSVRSPFHSSMLTPHVSVKSKQSVNAFHDQPLRLSHRDFLSAFVSCLKRPRCIPLIFYH